MSGDKMPLWDGEFAERIALLVLKIFAAALITFAGKRAEHVITMVLDHATRRKEKRAARVKRVKHGAQSVEDDTDG